MPGQVDEVPEIPDHHMIRCIGSGNYGKVWLGRNVMGSFRAIKVIHRKNFHIQRPYDREYAGIMKYEPLSRSHSGFVSVLHIGRNSEKEFFFYIMEVADDVSTGQDIDAEKYEAKTLRTELSQYGLLPVPYCVEIGMQLASALGHLHKNGLVHRDVKPSNIIFVFGAPKFADIGLVTDIGEATTFVGSEGYVPPEGPGQPAADVYGLGKVLYECITGENQLDYPQLPPDFNQLPDAKDRMKLMDVIAHACEVDQRKRIQNAKEFYEGFRKLDLEDESGETTQPAAEIISRKSLESTKFVIVGDTNGDGCKPLMDFLSSTIETEGGTLFVDQNTNADAGWENNMDWAQTIEQEILNSDVVVAILTETSCNSELLAYELQQAQIQSEQNDGKPRIVPVKIRTNNPIPENLADLFDATTKTLIWDSVEDNSGLFRDLKGAVVLPMAFPKTEVGPRLESPGGAVPLESPFYLTRPQDTALQSAIKERTSIVLIKGARQMGKTSMLARGMQTAREQDFEVVLTDYQQFNATCFESIEKFYFALCNSLADKLDLDNLPEDVWDSRRDPNGNLERYVKREVLKNLKTHFVWAMDEIDRLFTCPFSTEVFSLFRSWHNNRALDPTAPWAKLTLAVAYATEAHLFISDLVQSPFNVGTRLTLEDFQPNQVEEMNRLHGSPLGNNDQIKQFIDLVGGQPYLVRCALHELANGKLSFDGLIKQAQEEEGIFGDHLRRMAMLLAKDGTLVDDIKSILTDAACLSQASFYRLRTAGLIIGQSHESVRFRCNLYASYLKKQLS